MAGLACREHVLAGRGRSDATRRRTGHWDSPWLRGGPGGATWAGAGPVWFLIFTNRYHWGPRPSAERTATPQAATDQSRSGPGGPFRPFIKHAAAGVADACLCAPAIADAGRSTAA